MRRLAATVVLIALLAGMPAFISSLGLRAAGAQPPPDHPSGPGSPSGPGAPAGPGNPGGPSGPGAPAGPGNPGGPGGRPPFPGMESLNADSIAAERDSMMKAELDRIAGREEAPAESVFKNIKTMKGVPAGRLLRAMNGGFGRNLGVSCRFCHIPGHWGDDDKPNKQIARDMMAMTRAINDTLLVRVSNPKNDRRVVNCGTCHHGHPNPNWEMMRGRPGGPGSPGGPGGSEGPH